MSVQKKEVEGLLAVLAKHKIAVGFVNNGEENDADVFVTDPDFINEVMACDESHIYVFWKQGPAHSRPVLSLVHLFLVFGNEPGVVVADYSIPSEKDFADALDEALNEHYEDWSGDKS